MPREEVRPIGKKKVKRIVVCLTVVAAATNLLLALVGLIEVLMSLSH